MTKPVRTLLTRTDLVETPTDTSLRLYETDDGFFTLRKGRDLLMSDHDMESTGACLMLVLDLFKVWNPKWSLAMIGMGLTVIPRLLKFAPLADRTIYELEQCIIDWNTKEAPWKGELVQWNIVKGDYRKTLAGPHDVLIHDAGDVPSDTFLREHVRPGGYVCVYKNDALYHLRKLD